MGELKANICGLSSAVEEPYITRQGADQEFKIKTEKEKAWRSYAAEVD